jgi:hypothetical protein
MTGGRARRREAKAALYGLSASTEAPNAEQRELTAALRRLRDDSH